MTPEISQQEPRQEAEEVLEISDPAAAALLADPGRVRLLLPFVGQARSVSAAATFLREPLHRLRYWARRFEAAGLLREVGRQSRAGSAIRLYRTPADRLRVPLHLLPAESDEARLAAHFALAGNAFYRSIARAMRQAEGNWQIEVARGPAGGQLDYLRADGSPPSDHLNTWTVLHLPPGRAQNLHRELADLLARYEAENLLRDEDANNPEAPLLLMHLGLVRLHRR